MEKKKWESSKDFKEAFKKVSDLLQPKCSFGCLGAVGSENRFYVFEITTTGAVAKKKKNPYPASSILSFAAAPPRLPSALLSHCKISTR